MTSRERPLVLLADDHRMVAEGIANLVSRDYALLEVVSDGEALFESAVEHHPDVIVTDVSMPKMGGIEAVKRLMSVGHEIPVIFMTVHNEPATVREAIQSGARGYVLKAAAGEELLKAMHEVCSGRVYVSPELWPYISGQRQLPSLTNMQKRVLGLLSSGMRSREIATRLCVSVRTVDSHRYAIMRTLGVTSSVALIREAERLGLIKH